MFRQRVQALDHILPKIQLPKTVQPRERREIVNPVSGEPQLSKCNCLFKTMQIRYVAVRSTQFRQLPHVLGRDRRSRVLAQGTLHRRAQGRIAKRGQVSNVLVRIVSDTVAIRVLPLGRIQRKRVFAVGDAVVVVVGVCVVSDPVAVHIEPVAGIIGSCISCIHDPVAVRIRSWLAVCRDLKPKHIQRRDRVGAVQFALGYAARSLAAVAVRVRKHTSQNPWVAAVGHDGSKPGRFAPWGDVMPARPSPGSIGLPLSGRVRQPHRVT